MGTIDSKAFFKNLYESINLSALLEYQTKDLKSNNENAIMAILEVRRLDLLKKMNMLIALDDKSKLEEFVKQLPESFILDLDIYENFSEFQGGEFFISHFTKTKYSIYLELPFAEFLNPAIEEARKKLNNSYDKLFGFFVLKPNSTVTCADRLKKIIKGEEKIEFNKRLNEFTSAYYSFLKIAHYELTSINLKASKYIDKIGENYVYRGKIIDISKENDAYRIFNILYNKLPDGGFITYDDIIEEMKTIDSLKKTKMYSKGKKITFIQNNLTGTSNGFLKYSKIPLTQDNGKKLIKSIRAKSIKQRGIEFNNNSN